MSEAPPTYLALDLWMALGFDSEEFGAYCEQNGFGNTWAKLLDVVKGPQRPCAEPVDSDNWCVLREGHGGPHYAVSDVGPPNDLLAKYWAIHGLGSQP